MNLGIISHSLSLGGVEIGKRYVFSVSMSQMCGSIPIYAADCLTEITDKVEAYLQKRYNRKRISRYTGSIKLFDEDGTLVSRDSTESIALFVNSRKDLEKLLGLVDATYTKYEKVAECIKYNLHTYADAVEKSCKVSGISVPERFKIDEDLLGFETRFIGGYGAWSGDEDICDADILNKDVCSKINEIVSGFNFKVEGKQVKLSWQTGEKAYTYFYFKVS